MIITIKKCLIQRGTRASAQASTGRDCTGSWGRVKTKHQNRMKALLGGPSEEVVFTDQQLCQTGVRADQELAGEQQPDTKIEMQLCNFGQIRRKQNAMSWGPLGPQTHSMLSFDEP